MFARLAVRLLVVVLVSVSECTVVRCCWNESAEAVDAECSEQDETRVRLSGIVDLSNETVVEHVICLAGGNPNCSDIILNTTLLFENCSSPIQPQTCDSLSTSLKFWGASIVALANTIYIVPYLFVVALYLCMSSMPKRLYDRAVTSFCITQVGSSTVLCIMAYFSLCHQPLHHLWYTFFGLTLMFLTIAAVLWQLVICFDMTNAITRFEWTHGQDTKRRDGRKFAVYSAMVWGVSAGLTGLACFIEFAPFIPDHWSIKPHFDKYDTVNAPVIVWVISVPVLVCLATNALFFYTTYVIVKTRKKNVASQQNRQNQMRTYFFYLRLYLLMDAPWISGALGSIYPNLWLFKLVRMLHPIAMLFAMLPREKFLVIIEGVKKLLKMKKKEVN